MELQRKGQMEEILCRKDLYCVPNIVTPSHMGLFKFKLIKIGF